MLDLTIKFLNYLRIRHWHPSCWCGHILSAFYHVCFLCRLELPFLPLKQIMLLSHWYPRKNCRCKCEWNVAACLDERNRNKVSIYTIAGNFFKLLGLNLSVCKVIGMGSTSKANGSADILQNRGLPSHLLDYTNDHTVHKYAFNNSTSTVRREKVIEIRQKIWFYSKELIKQTQNIDSL